MLLRRAEVYEAYCSYRRLGDLVGYRCAASCEKRSNGELVSLDPPEIAIARVDKLLREILEDTKAPHYKVFLSGGRNFRYEIFPEYKANRDNTPKPEHLDICREFIATEWKASVTDGYEADDALGINQTEETIICSLDKDMLMIPGHHFSWRIEGTSPKGTPWVREAKFSKVSEIGGLATFYKQMLIGDTADNVIGVRGIGEVKAAKIVDVFNTEEGMFGAVHQLYANPERFATNADVLWIMQEEGIKYSDRNKGGLHG